MGSWNSTDALTQLAIGGGDPCRLIILLPYRYSADNLGGGFCHSTGLYEPFGLPIKGKYNTYGCINDIEEDLNTKFIVRWFEEAFIKGDLTFSERAKDLDKYDNIIPKEKNPKFTISQILEWIERHYIGKKITSDYASTAFMHLKHHQEFKAKDQLALSVLKPNQAEQIEKLNPEDFKMSVPFSFMLILEEVYQTALNTAGNLESSFYNYETNTSYKSDLKSYISNLCNTYLDYYKSIARSKELSKRVKSDKISEEFLSTRFSLFEMRNDLFPNLINDFIRNDVVPYVTEELEAGNNDQVEQWMNLVRDYKIVDDFMELARKSYAPQAGAGSQTDKYLFSKALAETTLKICDERESEHAKYREEEAKWLESYKKENEKKKSKRSKEK